MERELKRERQLALCNKDLDFRGGSFKRKQFNKSLLSRIAAKEEPYQKGKSTYQSSSGVPMAYNEVMDLMDQ